MFRLHHQKLDLSIIKWDKKLIFKAVTCCKNQWTYSVSGVAIRDMSGNQKGYMYCNMTRCLLENHDSTRASALSGKRYDVVLFPLYFNNVLCYYKSNSVTPYETTWRRNMTTIFTLQTIGRAVACLGCQYPDVFPLWARIPSVTKINIT